MEHVKHSTTPSARINGASAHRPGHSIRLEDARSAAVAATDGGPDTFPHDRHDEDPGDIVYCRLDQSYALLNAILNTWNDEEADFEQPPEYLRASLLGIQALVNEGRHAMNTEVLERLAVMARNGEHKARRQ